MKPSIGRTVIVKGIQSNGVDEHPAVINRVWDGGDTAEGFRCVNVMVFPDGGTPTCRTSVPLCDDREKALAIVPSPNDTNAVAFWPERVA